MSHGSVREGEMNPATTQGGFEPPAEVGLQRTLKQSEACEVLGNANVDNSVGYVSRSLNGRHVQFIALGGTIGTGLFVGIGRALVQGGPLSLLLGYSLTAVAVYGMVCLQFTPRLEGLLTSSCSDAIARRNDYLATAARGHSSILWAIRR